MATTIVTVAAAKLLTSPLTSPLMSPAEVIVVKPTDAPACELASFKIGRWITRPTSTISLA
jgi:hypothetical protein